MQIEISYHISWRRDSGVGICDSNAVANKSLLRGEGSLQCLYGCTRSPLVITQMSFICTDFSVSENWLFGEHQLRYNFTTTVDTTITIGFIGFAWVIGGSWNVSTTFSLIKRNDTGRINSSPRAITAPVIRLQLGCNHTLPLAVSDPDNDIIRCRWAVGRECAGICSQTYFPGAVLDSNSCTIRYQANRGAGFKGVALMIEDFVAGSLRPLSSVAFQFLVFIVSSNQPCSQKPEFIHPTLPQGSCVAIPSGATFMTQLTANSGSSSVSIREIQTVSPVGTRRGQLQQIPNTNTYYVNITWTPGVNQQNRTHTLCFTAINSAGLASDQSCIKLLAGHFPPRAVSSGLQSVSPSNTTLYIRFDKTVQRPTIAADIVIYEFNSRIEIYRIDSSLSQELTFNSSNEVKIMPKHMFTEKIRYYINIERGAVNGLEGCGPGNEAVVDNSTWTFEVLDETPPVVTFTNRSNLSNGNITLSWKSNENATMKCDLVSGVMVSMVNCSGGKWSGYDLSEGIYRLQINATDEAGNVARVVHTFEVDRTSPIITITQKPMPVSSQIRSTLRFRCNEICSLKCRFSSGTQNFSALQPCRNGIFNTPTLQHNVSYTLFVTATDQIGNTANGVTYTWETDFIPPVIFGVKNVSVLCSDISINHTGQAKATDDKSVSPSIRFIDLNQGCSIKRTWIATDDAGNDVLLIQMIYLKFSPILSLLPQVSFSCDSTLRSVTVPTNTATASNPCKLPLELSFTDSVNKHTCPSSFVRNWTVSVCNQTISQLQNINLRDLCPPNACGRNESIPRGICSLGECQCIRPWFGGNCSVLIHNPVIEPVDNLTLQEAQQYSVTLNISQGTPPLSWSLVSGPSRLRIDQLTGKVIWNRVQAGNHSITVKVENQVGRSEITWNLNVKPGYSTALNTVSPTLYSQAQPIVLTGMVEYIPNSTVKEVLAGIVPVFIDIINAGVTRTLRTLTDTDGSFSVTFYPTVTEYGSYQAGSRHPSSVESVSHTGWGFLGFSARPNRIMLTGEAVSAFNETFHNATILYNDGPGTLIGLTATSSLSNSEIISISIFMRGSKINNTLEPGDKLLIDIQLQASRPLNGFFTLNIQSAQGTTLHLPVNFQIKPILPQFLINPPSVNTRIIRGAAGSRVLEFNVTNIGRTVATNVRSLLPKTNIITFISFRNLQNTNTTNFNLNNGESAVLSVLVQTTASQQLGDISSSIAIISTQVSSSIPLRLTISSNVSMNLTVVVEDEFTYFASGKPLVNDATITLINYHRNIRIKQTTKMDNGTATFFNIPEDRYEMFAEAPDHLSIRQVIITSLNNPMVTVFLQRQTVTYTWSVTPIQFQDNYVLTVEADFVTNVPIPIVTVSPEEIDLEELEFGFVSSFQLNMTNQGLIRANEVRMQFPTNHPFLSFNSTTNDLGFIEPLSSVTVTVHVSRKNIQKRVSVIWVIYTINIFYNYVCGDLITRVVPTVLRRREIVDSPKPRPITNRISCANCLTGNGPSDGGVTFNFNGYSARTPAFCNKCIQSILGCARTPKFPGVGCIPLAVSGTNPFSSVSNAIDWISCIVDIDFLDYALCLKSLYTDCLSGGGNTRKKRNIDRTVNELAESLYPILQSVNLTIEVLGDRAWLSVGDRMWLSKVLQPALDDNSEGGTLISVAEFSAIMAAPPPNGTTTELVKNMITRINSTIYGWNNGELEPSEELNIASFSKVKQLSQSINASNDKAIKKGFSSYLDAYNFASGEVNKIERWEDEAGVCAVVRIRIEQELAVTRTAFLAKLEIENMESSPLENGNLEILIIESGTGKRATHLFAIGNSSLSGSLTGSSHKGWSLPSEKSGSISTLIIPFSEAAPKTDRAYDVGGTLIYTLDGDNITIPLLPTLITVTPDPSLRVHYFWERFVIGDDPFTDEVENSLPFTLGVAVKNAGYGTANSLQITSGQPEIIENRRGLLINFMIIGAMIGNGSVNPSLTVKFGDLAPNTTIVARWQMISSLQGEFKNYSATFENINPLGDPNLSILDELEIHELIRNVKIYNSPEEDDVLDFLVNEQDDFLAYPDALYSSKTLQHYNVSVGTVLSVHPTLTTGKIILSINTSSNSTGWIYYRYEDTQGIFRNIVPSNKIVKQVDNRTVSLPIENTWITRDKDSTLEKDTFYLHLVDNVASVGETIFNISWCVTNCSTVEMPFRRATTGKQCVCIGIKVATV